MKENEIPYDPADDNWFKYLKEKFYVIMEPDDESWEIYWADCDINYNDSDNPQADESLKNFVCAAINPCVGHEGANCNPGKRKLIFGELSSENLCTSTLCFSGPTDEELKYIKRLAKMRKQNIVNLKHAK